MMKLSSCLRNLGLSFLLLIVLVQCEARDLEDRDVNLDDDTQLSERFSEETEAKKRELIDSLRALAGAFAKESRNVVADVDRRHWFNNAERDAPAAPKPGMDILKAVIGAVAKAALKNAAASAEAAP